MGGDVFQFEMTFYFVLEENAFAGNWIFRKMNQPKQENNEMFGFHRLATHAGAGKYVFA